MAELRTRPATARVTQREPTTHGDRVARQKARFERTSRAFWMPPATG